MLTKETSEHTTSLSERTTPIPPVVERNHEKRIQSLEEDSGKILGGIGNLEKNYSELVKRIESIEKLKEESQYRDEIPSVTSISVYPNRARFNFKNVDYRVILIVAVTIVAVVWLITR